MTEKVLESLVVFSPSAMRDWEKLAGASALPRAMTLAWSGVGTEIFMVRVANDREGMKERVINSNKNGLCVFFEGFGEARNVDNRTRFVDCSRVATYPTPWLGIKK